MKLKVVGIGLLLCVAGFIAYALTIGSYEPYTLYGRDFD